MSVASVSDTRNLPPVQPSRQAAPVERDAGEDKDKAAAKAAADKAAEDRKPSSEPLPTDPSKGRNLNISV